MINIVIGKPGSGKTYHMVRYLFDLLVDLLKKQDNDRKIFTNISVNIDEFNRQLSEVFKQTIDITGLLVTLTADDLKYDSRKVALEDRVEKRVAGKSFYSVAASSQAFFWNRFPDNALILIDEIQKYLSTVREESESERQSLIEYFSLHRHRRHDWFFITQNLLSLPIEVRRVSEKVYNIFNAKSMSLGFPINIPMRDIETLLAGFNISRQVYRVREGYLESTSRVTYDDSVEVVIMEKRVFALYQTHTQLKTNKEAALFRGDSALPFDLGKGQQLRAIAWFLKKHGFHLGIKLFIVSWFIGGVFVFLYHHSAGYLEKHGIVKSVAAELKPPNNSDSSELHDIAPELVDDDDLSSVPVSVPLLSSDDSQIIYNRILSINGKEYREGDILQGKRIFAINAREGVTYESPEIQYFRDFAFLDDCRRWLSICGTNSGADDGRRQEDSSRDR